MHDITSRLSHTCSFDGFNTLPCETVNRLIDRYMLNNMNWLFCIFPYKFNVSITVHVCQSRNFKKSSSNDEIVEFVLVLTTFAAKTIGKSLRLWCAERRDPGFWAKQQERAWVVEIPANRVSVQASQAAFGIQLHFWTCEVVFC